ncbi:HEPN domain-containing protein [Streptomyces griseorubiginosus]|uniref:HEPN domain-containing protein n=1 Tax=Streptomyces griseorubiginosus TaxID=67304 RepID=UPI000AFFA79B|nr:HEPN domain-containing protein [Streptomyces griseorubiginosus]
MPSSRFQDLETRIADLEKHLIPSPFDPTGSYDDVVYELTRAFKVLVHAEFEAFIEDRVIEVVNTAFSRWEYSGVISTSLLSVVAYKESLHSMPESLSDASQKKKYPDLKARVEAAKNEFNRYVRTQNHGIKEKNILRLLMPIGITEKEIDPVWLNATETWATARGEVAHKAAKMQVRPDPQNEVKAVRQILAGFRDVDVLMTTK